MPECQEVKEPVATMSTQEPGDVQDTVMHMPPPAPLEWTNDNGTRIKFVVEEDTDDDEADEGDEYKSDARMIENVYSPQMMQEVLEKWRPRIGHHFAKEDDFETFMKLPIPIESRLTILETMIKASYKPRRSRKRRAQSDIKQE